VDGPYGKIRREIETRRAYSNINFRLKDKILENSQDLEVVFTGNERVNPGSIYYFAIQHKEQEIYSE